jgi:hypothetical protein
MSDGAANSTRRSTLQVVHEIMDHFTMRRRGEKYGSGGLHVGELRTGKSGRNFVVAADVVSFGTELRRTLQNHFESFSDDVNP